MTTATQFADARPGDTARTIIAERWPELAQHLATVQPYTVYLAGADFGYPFDATHVNLSAFCKSSPKANASGLTVTSYAGDAVPTEMNFLSYYRDLENFIASKFCKDCKFVNLGQFSARIAGVSHEVVA